MIAAVFPGQGSQKPGMGMALIAESGAAAEVFDRASEAVDIDLWALCNYDEETLRQTQNAQLALFVCGVAAFGAYGHEFADGFVAAGHSVGEYAALTAAGFLSIEDGAKLVRTRGELMAAAGQTNPGTMAAVLGLERDAIQTVLDGIDGVVVIANDNCPGQLVISGEVSAVQAASAALSAAGAKRVLPLNVSGAFHSPLMAEPAIRMGEALRAATFHPGRCPVYSNVLASPVVDPTVWPDLLERQLSSPVRWTESVQRMIEDGVDRFVELGGGSVLCGLIGRIDKSVATEAKG